MPKRSKLSREQKTKRKKWVLDLLKDVEEFKSKPKSLMNKIPVKNQFLETRNEDSKPIKYTENDIVNTS